MGRDAGRSLKKTTRRRGEERKRIVGRGRRAQQGHSTLLLLLKWVPSQQQRAVQYSNTLATPSLFDTDPTWYIQCVPYSTLIGLLFFSLRIFIITNVCTSSSSMSSLPLSLPFSQWPPSGNNCNQHSSSVEYSLFIHHIAMYGVRLTVSWYDNME